MDKVENLLGKLESSGLRKVKDNLRHGRYSSWKISYVEEWIEKEEASTVMHDKVRATRNTMPPDPPKDETERLIRRLRNKYPKIITSGIAVVGIAAVVGALKTVGVFNALAPPPDRPNPALEKAIIEFEQSVEGKSQ